MIFGRFLHFVIYDSAAAVAVGMWEAAFCAAFQAWRAGEKNAITKLTLPPSERHFHSEFANFRHLWRIFAS